MMLTEIVIPDLIMAQVRKHLFNPENLKRITNQQDQSKKRTPATSSEDLDDFPEWAKEDLSLDMNWEGPVENHCFLFGRTVPIKGENGDEKAEKLIIGRFWPTPPEYLSLQHVVRVSLRKEYVVQALEYARKNGFSIIDVHSHPMDVNGPYFSDIDIRSGNENASWLDQKIKEGKFPEIYWGMIVIGEQAWLAVHWSSKEKEFLLTPIRRVSDIFCPSTIIDHRRSRDKKEKEKLLLSQENRSYQRLHDSLPAEMENSRKKRNQKQLTLKERASLPISPFHYVDVPTKPDDNDKNYEITELERDLSTDLQIYDRQIRLWGVRGQSRLSKVHVGVVGCGGLGTLVVMQLVKIGVQRFTLIDPDLVDVTNLPRLPIIFQDSVGNYKVHALEEYIHHVNPMCSVKTVPRNFTKYQFKTLQGCDVIIGCVDSEGARSLLNEFSVRYLIPYFDAGTGVYIDQNQTVQYMGGQVRFINPGTGPCLYCYRGGIRTSEVILDLLTDEQRQERRALGYVDGTDLTPTPSVLPLNMTIASILITEFSNFVTQFSYPSYYIHYDAVRMQVRDLAKENPKKFRTVRSCPMCGIGGYLGIANADAQVYVTPEERETILLYLRKTRPIYEKMLQKRKMLLQQAESQRKES